MRKNLHYDVGQYIGTKNIDVLITIGDLARHIAMEQTIIWKHILVHMIVRYTALMIWKNSIWHIRQSLRIMIIY